MIHIMTVMMMMRIIKKTHPKLPFYVNPFLVVEQNLLKFFNCKRKFVVTVAYGNDDDDDDDNDDDDVDDDDDCDDDDDDEKTTDHLGAARIDSRWFICRL